MEVFIINDLKKTDFKFGGLYYHYKKTDDNTPERELLKKKTRQKSFNSQENSQISFLDLINLSEQEAYDKIYSPLFDTGNSISTLNPFDVLNKSLSNNKKIIDKDNIVLGDKIIILPFTGILDNNFLDNNKLSIIAIELPSGLCFGMIVLSKLIKEYQDLIKKGIING